MTRRILSLIGCCVFWITAASAQQTFNRFNFNVGGGLAAGVGDIGKFTSKSYQGGAGGGINFSRLFGVDTEYMYYNLSFKDNIVHDQNLPDATGRLQSVTLNAILRIPLPSKWGIYGIAGGGWYRRSVEARTQVLVPGTICQPAWVLWGIACTNNLITETQTLSSRTLNAGGYNIGGGVTYRIPFHHAKFYVEGRLHHANHNDVKTSIFPVTFGLRW